MHTMQTPMVSIKAVELLYTPRLSDQIQWERTADSRLPPGDLEFVLADRTAPPRKPPKTKKKKPGKDDNSWGGIRYARLTLKNSKVTITDLGYTSKLGDRISVNFKGLGGCGRPHTLQDGDVIEFPARARTSAERVDNAEAQNITVRVKFLLELEKDGPIIWHFMPEPSTSPEELASLASSAHSAPIKSEGRTRKGRAALKILTSPLPEGVVTSPVPPSATTPARTEPSTPQARPPLRPGLYRNSGTPSASVPPLEHTGGAFQSSPSSLRKWPIGNTAGSETDWTSSSSSSLFSRSSLVLSSPSPPTTPDESPEQSRAPSPESRKPTVGRAMRSRVTSSETFLRPTRETRRTSRPIRARSPSAEAGSPSPTVNVTRPPIIASVDGRTPTFVFDGEPVPSISGRQAKPLKAGAGQRGSKNDKPPRTGVEFVREKSDEGANIIEMKAEKIPSSDHDFRLVGPFYTETKRGPIDEYCYARLTLKPSKVTIARIGSCIRLQSKSHSFEFRETGQTHPLEDGDMITFQASQDNRNPISFKVNFLTRPVPADCPIRFLSKSTQDSVLRHPPSQLGKAPSASPVFTGRDGPESKVDIETDENWWNELNFRGRMT
ncbi:hypothetical protein C8F04DRAFT_599103 [Mycena alexandri]|uniref:Uncharacterized protein n=1 Tax=Mycena alexandri TaxID=1745969 RepID=A0AAD6TE80_9AGAR|nr:hypothetical protein C8F04DRAFT_599103 [Mycena alexandri]